LDHRIIDPSISETIGTTL